MRAKIKAITFDLDDTFWDIGPVIINAEIKTREWIESSLDEEIAWGDYESFMLLREDLIKKNERLAYDLGALRRESIKHHVRHAFSNEKQLDDFVESAFEIFFDLRQQVTLYPHVKDFLNAASAKLPLGILTNGNADVKKIGIDKFFKCHFTSLDVKSNKPSSKHFKKAVEFFNVLPEEILHVGDDKIADISGCIRAGLNPLWFNNKSNEWDLDLEEPPQISSWENALEYIEQNYEF